VFAEITCPLPARSKAACLTENRPVRKITVRHTIGTALQFCCLVFLPLMVIFSINFYDFPLVVMPVSLLITIAIFSLGQVLKSE